MLSKSIDDPPTRPDWLAGGDNLIRCEDRAHGVIGEPRACRVRGGLRDDFPHGRGPQVEPLHGMRGSMGVWNGNVFWIHQDNGMKKGENERMEDVASCALSREVDAAHVLVLKRDSYLSISHLPSE